MHGPIARMILSQGKEYQLRNASGGGGRNTPSYSDDGTITGVLESRGMPQTATDSSGTEVETDLEIRAVPEEATLRPAGSADGYPTLLKHPTGAEYRLLDKYLEDAGVTVLTVMED
ncbi:hypothetical protein [Natronorubrum halophilum]|uniref:hypothetical protein n=1 Tax=Natronorubrum halophilum TaxID=1702106 RepID=UPI0010C1FA73|nr:hypothetical protein [Natronorubrum halophilum]